MIHRKPLPQKPVLLTLTVLLTLLTGCGSVTIRLEHPDAPTASTATQTVPPTATSEVKEGALLPTPPPTPTLFGTPSPTPCTLDSIFIADVTVPDDTEFPPGTPFTKAWRVRNSGTCAWEAGTQLVFSSGNSLGGSTVTLADPVAPGDTVDIEVAMVAPTTPGSYKSTWRLQTPDGTRIGSVYAQIVVPDPATATPTLPPTPSEPNFRWTNHDLDLPGAAWGRPIDIASDGTVWLGANGVGVGRYNGYTWTWYTDEYGLHEILIQDIAVAPDGSVWVSSRDGVARYDGYAWTIYTTEDGLPSNTANSIAVDDRDGMVWVGTDKGLASYDGFTWQTHGFSHVERVVVDGWYHAVWVVSEGQLHYSRDSVQGHRDFDDLPHPFDNVSDIAAAHDGIWVITEGLELYHISWHHGFPTWSTDRDGLDYLSQITSEINAIVTAPDGSVWVSLGDYTARGVVCYDGHTWSHHLESQVVTRDIAVANDGTVWVVGSQGLWKGTPAQ